MCSHVLKEWFAAAVEKLQVATTRVARAYEHKGAGPAAGKKWLHGIAAHVRRHRDSIEAETIKYRAGVECGRVSDVAPFGIGYGQRVPAGEWNKLAEQIHTSAPERLEKCKIEFVGRSGRSCGLNNCRTEGANRLQGVLAKVGR